MKALSGGSEGCNGDLDSSSCGGVDGGEGAYPYVTAAVRSR